MKYTANSQSSVKGEHKCPFELAEVDLRVDHVIYFANEQL